MVFRKTVLETIKDLQKELDTWIEYYNREPHTKAKCGCGGTAIETLVDGKKIWFNRNLTAD